ncbi:MAG: hypothetical protein Q9171_000974 [Xanthocarpia ochracea]
MFDLGNSLYHLELQNLKLVARTRIHATLPSPLVQYTSVQDLITSGLWITRGNGLGLRIRADFTHFASSLSDRDLLKDILCDTLPPFEELEAAFALNHADIPHIKHPPTETRPHPAIAPNSHDVRPPVGVPRGSIDSIELTLIFVPLVSLDVSSQPCYIREGLCRTGGRHLTSTAVQSSGRRSSTTIPYSFSDHSRVETGKSDGGILFQSLKMDIPSCDEPILDCGEEDPNTVPLPKKQLQRSVHCYSSPPSVRPRLQTQEPSIISHSALDPLEFMRLVDISLRQTLSGFIPSSKTLRRPSNDASEIQLVQLASDASLADISPALFRPGYIKSSNTHLITNRSNIQAISQRAPFISRIAFSISGICSRSRTRTHSPSDSTSPNLATPSSSDLPIHLWSLLQKRKWPTKPLEPLDDDISRNVFNRHERDRELIFDSDEFGSRVPWEVQRGEIDDDEDMLDSCIEFAGTLIDDDGDEDEDLFSSYERTPFSSQDMEGLEVKMLEGDGDEDLVLEEELLLSDEGDGFGVPVACQGDGGLRNMEAGEGDAYGGEDVEVELLEFGCECEDRALMMLF